MQGESVKLSDFIGKPVVLNFWASWCPPCKREMPHFNEVYSEFKNEVEFMMVDLVDGKRETVEKGKKHIQDQGYNFPVYFDTNQGAAAAYNISSIPTTVLIDAQGNIADVYQGYMEKDELISGIRLIQK
jgi:thiol-disulfide isomerase/thioredoxin